MTDPDDGEIKLHLKARLGLEARYLFSDGLLHGEQEYGQHAVTALVPTLTDLAQQHTGRYPVGPGSGHAFKDICSDAQHDALEKACGSLRTSYEDLIQKKLFNNVVRRWRENITFTLNQVFFDEDIAVRVHERMVALSRYIDAHSHSDEFHEVPLTLSVVTTKLAHFDAIKADYTKARKAWEKANEKPKLNFN